MSTKAGQLGSGAGGFFAYSESLLPRESSDSPDFGISELQPVVEEWRESPGGIFGLEYFTSTFNEYLAESYARLLCGDSVPDATRRFLESYSDAVAQ